MYVRKIEDGKSSENVQSLLSLFLQIFVTMEKIFWVNIFKSIFVFVLGYFYIIVSFPIQSELTGGSRYKLL